MNRAANWTYQHAHQIVVIAAALMVLLSDGGDGPRPLRSLLTGIEASFVCYALRRMRTRVDPWFRE